MLIVIDKSAHCTGFRRSFFFGMEGTINVSSAIQSNSLEAVKSKDAVTVNHTLNGNQQVLSPPGDRHFHPVKTMHVMTPGPKKYQSIKKSPDKEPKFVPYEPYKAAVRSIVPELSQPSVAVFKRKLSTASNCSKGSNVFEDKEDMITALSQEKQVHNNTVIYSCPYLIIN